MTRQGLQRLAGASARSPRTQRSGRRFATLCPGFLRLAGVAKRWQRRQRFVRAPPPRAAGHAPPVRNRRLAGETGSKPVGDDGAGIAEIPPSPRGRARTAGLKPASGRQNRLEAGWGDGAAEAGMAQRAVTPEAMTYGTNSCPNREAAPESAHGFHIVRISDSMKA